MQSKTPDLAESVMPVTRHGLPHTPSRIIPTWEIQIAASLRFEQFLPPAPLL
jgi:hypothetical protein